MQSQKHNLKHKQVKLVVYLLICKYSDGRPNWAGSGPACLKRVMLGVCTCRPCWAWAGYELVFLKLGCAGHVWILSEIKMFMGHLYCRCWGMSRPNLTLEIQACIQPKLVTCPKYQIGACPFSQSGQDLSVIFFRTSYVLFLFFGNPGYLQCRLSRPKSLWT